jgi:hypothetical protein
VSLLHSVYVQFTTIYNDQSTTAAAVSLVIQSRYNNAAGEEVTFLRLCIITSGSILESRKAVAHIDRLRISYELLNPPAIAVANIPAQSFGHSAHIYVGRLRPRTFRLGQSSGTVILQ